MHEKACDQILRRATDWQNFRDMERLDLVTAALEVSSGDENIDFVDSAISQLLEDKVLTKTATGYRITDKGRAFIATTNYVAQKEAKDKEAAYQANLKEKLEHDTRLVRWHLKTRWMPLAISIISLILATTSLYYSVRRDKKVNQVTTQQNQRSADSVKNIK